MFILSYPKDLLDQENNSQYNKTYYKTHSKFFHD